MRSILLPGMAAWHRRRLDSVTFVAITGSAGKTTAKMLATAVLATAGRVQARGGNKTDKIMRSVCATRPDDNFCIIEVGASKPGSLDRPLALVRPSIGVVTAVGSDHLKAFHSIAAIAEEKAKVITCLPESGTAVLNADDPRVSAMADLFKGKVITFGCSADAALRAQDVRSRWPERLTFSAVYQGEAVEVRTRLCGTHWTTSVLAALAVGLAAGVPLAKAAKAMEAVEPYPGRMWPLTSNNGVTFILDDWKASHWIMPSAFDFLTSARASRKILVIGTLSDYGGDTAKVYAGVAKAALDVADHVLFVGPMATHALRAKTPETADRLRAFAGVKDAAAFLHPLLRRDDLVLVKGSVNADHLGRLAHHWLEPISCWRMDCGKNLLCRSCRELRTETKREALPARQAPVAIDNAVAALLQCSRPLQVLVGIGNPGSRYDNTPHNVGRAVLDALAGRLELAWTAHEDVLLTHTRLNGATLLLVKPQSAVNNTGKSLLRLAEVVDFKAEDCILVQDDIHLPLGKLRSRAHGSDGGHKGVRSALVSFQTDAVRRLKIGVAPAERPRSATDYLLAPFDAAAAAIIDTAVEAAVERLLSSITARMKSATDRSAAGDNRPRSKGE